MDGARKSLGEVFREADNNMYQEKLHRSSSIRSGLVNILMKALEARGYISQGHTERLQEMLTRFAKVLNLPDHAINSLRLLAQFHDVGKVGIPDRILFKPGVLNHEEKREMQGHPMIGYQIARSAPDLAPISDCILKHHEWWNGGGYPQGLKGEEIPLNCRLLAIVDAYDAMINDRPYRRAMTHQEAIEELQRCAGTQFDPVLVSEFIKLF